MKRKIKRFIVAGGVHFEDYETLKEALDDLFKEIPKDEIEIISGHARGADSLGEKYAEENGLKYTVFPADWKKYGRTAGPIRNRQMLDYALEEEAHLVAFWNGESRGTKNMIDIANKAGISIKIIGY